MPPPPPAAGSQASDAASSGRAKSHLECVQGVAGQQGSSGPLFRRPRPLQPGGQCRRRARLASALRNERQEGCQQAREPQAPHRAVRIVRPLFWRRFWAPLQAVCCLGGTRSCNLTYARSCKRCLPRPLGEDGCQGSTILCVLIRWKLDCKWLRVVAREKTQGVAGAAAGGSVAAAGSASSLLCEAPLSSAGPAEQPHACS